MFSGAFPSSQSLKLKRNAILKLQLFKKMPAAPENVLIYSRECLHTGMYYSREENKLKHRKLHLGNHESQHSDDKNSRKLSILSAPQAKKMVKKTVFWGIFVATIPPLSNNTPPCY